jgi:hypothetical protein
MATTPPSSATSGWSNQLLTLYHGTTRSNIPSILTGFVPARGRPYTDFGQGFYTTTVERQARSWAWQLSQRTLGDQPAIIRFDVNRDNLAVLECLSFVRGTRSADDFWSLVIHCRTGASAHGRTRNQGWYDVVIGPVAAAWRRRRIIQDTDQVSFHTALAAAVLDASNPREIPW